MSMALLFTLASGFFSLIGIFINNMSVQRRKVNAEREWNWSSLDLENRRVKNEISYWQKEMYALKGEKGQKITHCVNCGAEKDKKRCDYCGTRS